MRFQLEQEINVPRAKVVDLMIDQQNLTRWQPDLLSVEHLSGEPGRVGAKSKQVNQQGKRTLEIIETITVMNPPEELCATYEAGGVWNLIECRFYESGVDRTTWVLTSDFRSTNVMMKLLAFFAPGSLRNKPQQLCSGLKNLPKHLI